MSKIYRDNEGDIWLPIGTRVFEYVDIGVVQRDCGAMQELTHVPDDNRYMDRDGDVWLKQEDGQYLSEQVGYGMWSPTMDARYGPLVKYDPEVLVKILRDQVLDHD